MRLSTKGRYATRAMFDLAMHYGEGPVQLHHILDRQEISIDYLTHLFMKLKEAGLIESARGPNGGYYLAKPPSEIRVGDIVEVTEGPLAPTHCLLKGGDCHRADGCITRLLWEKLGSRISQFLNSVSLADLCREAARDCCPHGSE